MAVNIQDNYLSLFKLSVHRKKEEKSVKYWVMWIYYLWVKALPALPVDSSLYYNVLVEVLFVTFNYEVGAAVVVSVYWG